MAVYGRFKPHPKYRRAKDYGKSLCPTELLDHGGDHGPTRLINGKDVPLKYLKAVAIHQMKCFDANPGYKSYLREVVFDFPTKTKDIKGWEDLE